MAKSKKLALWIISIAGLITSSWPIFTVLQIVHDKVDQYNEMVIVYQAMGDIMDTIAHKEKVYGDKLKVWEIEVKQVRALIDSSGLSKEKFNRIEGLLENLSFALLGELDKYSYPGGIFIYKANNGTEFYYKKYLWPATINNNDMRYIYHDLDGKRHYCY